MPHAPPSNESTDLHGVAHIMRKYFGLGRKTQLRSHTSHGVMGPSSTKVDRQLQPYLGLHSKVNPPALHSRTWIIAAEYVPLAGLTYPPALLEPNAEARDIGGKELILRVVTEHNAQLIRCHTLLHTHRSLSVHAMDVGNAAATLFQPMKQTVS